jgi:MYXO-CTERM domain-containing protein
VSVLGYGLTESSEEGERWSARRRRDRVLVKYVDTLPNTFALGRSVCKGDSGGPALDSESGAVIGVYSLGIPGETVADCTSLNALNYYAQVNRYPDLLRQAFEAAGQPFPDDEPAGSGGADGGGAGGAPVDATPGGGESSALGGNGGSTTESPTAEVPASASGGCHVSRSGSPWPSVLAALLGLAALSRRRRSSSC